MTNYILGKEYTKEFKKKELDYSKLEEYVDIAYDFSVIDDALNVIEDHRDFYSYLGDLKELVPSSYKKELFYSLKLGYYSKNVSSECIYLLKSLFDKFGSVSLALLALPTATINTFFAEGYLENCTMRDVIKSYIDPEYEPLFEGRLRIKHKEYDEVYVYNEDMVALLPTKLSDTLTDKDILKLKRTGMGLEVDGSLIRYRCNYVGAVNSIYDLRNIV